MEAVGRQARGEVEPRPVKPQSNPGVSGRVSSRCSDPEGPSASPSSREPRSGLRAARTLGRRLKFAARRKPRAKKLGFPQVVPGVLQEHVCLSVCLRIQKGGMRLCFWRCIREIQTSEHLRRVSLAQRAIDQKKFRRISHLLKRAELLKAGESCSCLLFPVYLILPCARVWLSILISPTDWIIRSCDGQNSLLFLL